MRQARASGRRCHLSAIRLSVLALNHKLVGRDMDRDAVNTTLSRLSEISKNKASSRSWDPGSLKAKQFARSVTRTRRRLLPG